MSSRPESKTASQLAHSLTMKLKGKLNTQLIKRSERVKHTPSQRVKPSDLNLNQNQNQSVGVLEDQQRAVISSLQYLKALVDRLGVDKPGGDKLVMDQSVVGGLLGGASGRVLEAVHTLVQLEPQLHNSKTVSACLTRLYRSLAQLMRWADRVVMLQGISHDNEDSSESATTVIRAVLDSVKVLVRLVAERQEGSAPLSPVQSQSEGFGDKDTSDSTSTCLIPAQDNEEVKTDLKRLEPPIPAPPKPPMLPLQVTPPQGMSPPALPPKKRQTSSIPSPAPCRVAIVAPMIREPEVYTEVKQELDDDCLKRLSSCSADSAAHSINCEDDPDYDFLNTDLSSSETLPPFPASSSLAPALPEKRRRSFAGIINSQTPPSFGFDSTPEDLSSAVSKNVTGPDEPVSSPLSPSKTPPPLPEKKRHIHQYLQICSLYSDQSPVLFYQKPPALSQKYNNKQRDLDATNQTHKTHLETNFAPSPEHLPAPALPPKKKQQDSTNSESEDCQSGDSSQSDQQEAELSQSSSEEELVEELLLTNQQEVLDRITMKSEDEEGPDVKAASPEILLVHATECNGTEQDLYREAFLCTYRSFINPFDIISKLQHRYRHLCEQQESADVTAAKNTFQLLVRVVEDLSAVELESDLLLLLMDLVSSLLIVGKLGPAHLLHSNILSKMEKRWQLIGSHQLVRPLAAKGVAARPGTLLDFGSQDLAEQLTLLDSDLFYKIELPEVLLWSKEQNEEKSPNLTAFTQHFNNVSFWVRSVIILQDKPHDREKLLLKFLKIMKHLRKLNNFNSYLSILSALDSAPLRRLEWQKNTSETLEEFSSLIDSSSSFRAYRAALAEVEPPCIPYLGLILQDLTFVHLGNPDCLMNSQDSKVNFSKRWQQFNILDTLRSYQQVRYSLQPDDDIISFFNDFSDHLAEEALWELSLRIRPRNTPRVSQR
ncbi:rap guanine nucleotide exchange factor 1-like isoform X2 [Melanotaenia boesemani]|uniref:rap guanine nucleotide exchange factor 1-like isoform X2 n=1 Tax=Melanotaenia boesemani TaxID=1250792 RepID=UPI001C04502D|nr:rap guanine nucleotide exchange factor 1-like isoform X2 [Melanotaenia boesemani]